jgi:hypothetical protein
MRVPSIGVLLAVIVMLAAFALMVGHVSTRISEH